MSEESKSTIEEKESGSETGSVFKLPPKRYTHGYVSPEEMRQAVEKAGFEFEAFSSRLHAQTPNMRNYNMREIWDGMNVLAKSQLNKQQKDAAVESIQANPTQADWIAKLYVVLCARGGNWQQRVRSFEKMVTTFLLKHTSNSRIYVPRFLENTVQLLEKFSSFSPSEGVWEYYLDFVFGESLLGYAKSDLFDLEGFLYKMGLLNEANIQAWKKNYLKINIGISALSKEIESSPPEQRQLYLDLCLFFPALAPQVAKLYLFLKGKNQSGKTGSDLSSSVGWFKDIIERGLVVHMLEVCKKLDGAKCCTPANMDILFKAVNDPTQSSRLLIASKMLLLSLTKKSSQNAIQQLFDRIMTGPSVSTPSAASPSSQAETKGDSKMAVTVSADEKQKPTAAIVARYLVDERNSRQTDEFHQLEQAESKMLPAGILRIIQEYTKADSAEDEKNRLQAEEFFSAKDIQRMETHIQKAVEAGWVSTLAYYNQETHFSKKSMESYLKLAVEKKQFDVVRFLLESTDFNQSYYSYTIQQAIAHKDFLLLQKLVTGEISPLAKKHCIVVDFSEQDINNKEKAWKEILRGFLYGPCCMSEYTRSARLFYATFEQLIPKLPPKAPPSKLTALGSATSQTPKGSSSGAAGEAPKEDGGCVIS